MDFSGLVKKIFENFLGKWEVGKIEKFRGHLLSSGHHKNSGGLRPLSKL